MSTHDHTHEAVPDNGGDLDPREAAALLDRTTRWAERQLDLHPPLLMLAASLVVLIAYGAIWLSVRGQHPYTGPSLGALGVLYATIAAFGVLVAVVAAAYEAAKENWEWSGFACAAVVLACAGAFTGPETVWAVMGVGLAALLLARTASRIWLHH